MKLRLARILLPLIFFSVMFTGGLMAQRSTVWTQVRDTFRYSLHSKPHFMLGFDSHRSFIASAQVKIFGLRTGLEFNRRIRTGIGLYFLSSPFYKNFIYYTDSAGWDTVNSRLNFGFVSGFFEYVFYKSKRWDFSVPTHLGIGNAEFQGVPQARSGLAVLESSLQGQYKIVPWFAIGAGAGYRQILASKVRVSENLSAPVYNISLRLFAGELYRTIFKNRKKKDALPPETPAAAPVPAP